MSLEREQRILARLDTKLEKANDAAEGALEQWVSYNPISGFSHKKDAALHQDWCRRLEIYKRVQIQREASALRVEELKKGDKTK